MVTFGRSHATIPYDRGSTLRFADLCSAQSRLFLGRRAIERIFSNPDNDDDDNSDDDDVSDDNDGDNVADDDAGAKAMLDGVDCAVAPKMNTSLVVASGMIGAVGGAKESAERNCGSG